MPVIADSWFVNSISLTPEKIHLRGETEARAVGVTDVAAEEVDVFTVDHVNEIANDGPQFIKMSNFCLWNPVQSRTVRLMSIPHELPIPESSISM